ncbi:MAG: hypothetical protein Q4C01_07220 [Clostridia bacterium]|nr:hypothetical protein [Clostridia bacterium]
MAKKDRQTGVKNYPYVTLSGEGSVEHEPANSGGSSSSSYNADFNAILDEMVQAFEPELIDYTPVDETELAGQIELWLRPIYAQSIEQREEQTDRTNAELDADALSRGMGSSTFVSDMKNRNARYEAEDITTIETEYGSTLAKYMFDALEADRERRLEVETFNANAKNEAYEKAYSAAESLYAAYQSGISGGGGGSSSSSNSSKEGSSSKYNPKDRARSIYEKLLGSVPATSKRACEQYLDGLSAKERKQVFTATGGYNLRVRAELMQSLGAQGYKELKNQYLN